jgi:hypothetical protein
VSKHEAVGEALRGQWDTRWIDFQTHRGSDRREAGRHEEVGRVQTWLLKSCDRWMLSVIGCYIEHRPLGSQQEAHWAKQLLTGTK